MPTAPQRVVVVGSSLAGVRAVEAMRRAGFTGRIVLVGAEKHFPPVDRPPLSKTFLHSDEAGPILRMAPDLDLDLHLGREAVRLDAHAHAVELDDGRRLEYDGLIIATGATVRQLPGTAGLSNVHVLRTVDDALRLRTGLAAAQRLVVIGAGVLGCEIAATGRKLGVDTTLVDTFDQPMLRVLGPKASAIVQDLHEQHGVRFRLGRSVVALDGAPHVRAVQLDRGEELPADIVAVAIGAVPETRWLEGSGLPLADGVMCDDCCFVPDTDRSVVAAGDVARWHHPLLDRHVRIEHWTNAVSQGQAAGRNLVAALTGGSEPEPYDVVPYFWTDQYDRKLQLLGILGEDIRYEEGEPGDEKVVISYWSGERMVGVLCVNRPSRIPYWRPRLTESWRSA